jgi:uncharacterized protein (TIGR02217 family)
MIFVDQRLPNEIEAGAKARPRYSTDEVETDGGWVITNSRWRYPLHQFEFNLEPGVRDEDDFYDPTQEGIRDVLDEFLDIFHVCGGSAGGFRFHYWRDKPVVHQPIGVGDGATLQFQLFRTYTRGAFTRDRKITRPVVGSVTVYVDGVPTVVGINYDTGLLTFSVAPLIGKIVTADFEHDVPVRFADDELEMIGLTDDLDQPVNIVLKEIRE